MKKRRSQPEKSGGNSAFTYKKQLMESSCTKIIAVSYTHLYLLNADSRMLFGSTSRNRPSRFSLEIPLDLINKTREQDWRKPDLGTKMPVAETELRRKSATAAMHLSLIHIFMPRHGLKSTQRKKICWKKPDLTPSPVRYF